MIETSDMYLGAALLAYGADYRGVDKKDKQRQKFLFSNDLKISFIYVYNATENEVELHAEPKFSDVCNFFDSFRLLYPPNYPQALKKLKTIIHK
jgi:hypothetical protein